MKLRQPDHCSLIIRALCDICDSRLSHIGPPSYSIFGFFFFGLYVRTSGSRRRFLYEYTCSLAGSCLGYLQTVFSLHVAYPMFNLVVSYGCSCFTVRKADRVLLQFSNCNALHHIALLTTNQLSQCGQLHDKHTATTQVVYLAQLNKGKIRSRYRKPSRC